MDQNNMGESFSRLDTWMRDNTQKLGRRGRPKTGDYEKATSGKQTGAWCHRSQGKNMCQEGCSNSTVECC